MNRLIHINEGDTVPGCRTNLPYDNVSRATNGGYKVLRLFLFNVENKRVRFYHIV